MILEDDKEVFPAGNVIFVTKKSTVEEAGPDYEKTILQVQEGLDLKVMQELDARVELEKQTPKEAAAAYLEERGVHRARLAEVGGEGVSGATAGRLRRPPRPTSKSPVSRGSGCRALRGRGSG